MIVSDKDRFIVTSITPQKRRKGGRNVYVVNALSKNDSEVFLMSIHAFDTKNPLEVGSIIDETVWKEQTRRFQYYRALEFASRKLNRAVISKTELENHLVKKGIPRDVAKDATEYCDKQEYLISNIEYAILYVDSKVRSDPMSIEKMRIKLKEKGISDNDIKKALKENDVDNLKVAIELTEKKFRKFLDEKTEKTSKRVIGALSYRGFSWAVIAKVLDHFKLPKNQWSE